MATLSLDVVILGRSDTNSTPRVRSRCASGCEVRFFASETPVQSMRRPACSQHEHGSFFLLPFFTFLPFCGRAERIFTLSVGRVDLVLDETVERALVLAQHRVLLD